MEPVTEPDLVLYKTQLVEVYKARLKSNNETVTVKKYKINSRDDVNLYNREILMMNRLNHRNIVGLRDYFMGGKGDKIEYVLFIMKFYEKGDLQKEIERRKKSKQKWPEQELWNHLKSLIEVFSYLQENDFAHRDIKPQSILIGDDDNLLVSSWGRAIKNSESFGQKSIAGTPLYLSPLLRIASSFHADECDHNVFKSDVYSLGLTFYYMVTLSDIKDFIDLNGLQNTLSDRINAINNYTEKIKNILLDMLVVDENERLDFILLRNKYFNDIINLKINPNNRLLARSNSYKVPNLKASWGNRKIIYIVRLKNEKSKDILTNVFTRIYWGTDWIRFSEYLYILFVSKIKIGIYKLICFCSLCGHPISDGSNAVRKFSDSWIHTSCYPDSLAYEENNYQACCIICCKYFSSIYENSICGHTFCEECIIINEPASFEKFLVCPECPCIWKPKLIDVQPDAIQK